MIEPMTKKDETIWQALKIDKRKAAEISTEVYLLLGEDIGFADGIKKLAEKYKGNELLLAIWSYAYLFAIGDAFVNGWLWVITTYQDALRWVKLAKENKEEVIKAIERGLKNYEKMQRAKRFDVGYVM